MPTFIISDTKPVKKPDVINVTDYLKEQDVVTQNAGHLLFHTAPTNPVHPHLDNGFVGAAFQAYSYHHGLILRPDDVWLALMIAFASYVNAHAEEMRLLFVSHDGKKQIDVKTNGSLANVDWNHIIKSFSNTINEYTKDQIRNWIEPDFRPRPTMID